MNHTTQTFARTSRPSGTEYASAIERTRHSDTSGITIVLVLGVVLACAMVGTWLGAAL